MTADPRATAVHEAAHAVVAKLLGVGIKRVVLHEGGGGTTYLDPAGGRRVRRALVILASGDLAEEIIPLPTVEDWALA